AAAVTNLRAQISLALGAALALTACGNSSPLGRDSGGTDQAPPLLSAEGAPGRIDSTQGSGAFGRWTVDRYGLPAYDYTLDQTSDARAARVELSNTTSAWHQLGNDAIVADAYNDG